MMEINKLPARTWEWLKVNETAVEDFDDVISKLSVKSYSINPGETADEPLRLDVEVSASGTGADLYEFEIGPQSSCTVIQFITSAGDGDGSRFCLRNRYPVEDGGSLTLIQIQDLPDTCEFVNECEGTCDDRASFSAIRIVLGGGKTYLGDRCSLSGERSSYKSDLGYRLEGSHMLDVNYVADHTGALSESDIKVSGVMADKAEKTFRGTIDFHRGCAGAKGAEIEEVLLLSDDIVNKTVPLILCDEEDVEGSHGATIGQLDDNLLFYMKSRGIDEDEIYAMMAHARIDTVVSLIQDMNVRDHVYEMIDGPVRRDCLKQ